MANVMDAAIRTYLAIETQTVVRAEMITRQHSTVVEGMANATHASLLVRHPSWGT